MSIGGSERPIRLDVGVNIGGGDADGEFALGDDGDHGGVVGGAFCLRKPQGQSFATAFPGQLPPWQGSPIVWLVFEAMRE